MIKTDVPATPSDQLHAVRKLQILSALVIKRVVSAEFLQRMIPALTVLAAPSQHLNVSIAGEAEKLKHLCILSLSQQAPLPHSTPSAQSPFSGSSQSAPIPASLPSSSSIPISHTTSPFPLIPPEMATSIMPTPPSELSAPSSEMPKPSSEPSKPSPMLRPSSPPHGVPPFLLGRSPPPFRAGSPPLRARSPPWRHGSPIPFNPFIRNPFAPPEMPSPPSKPSKDSKKKKSHDDDDDEEEEEETDEDEKEEEEEDDDDSDDDEDASSSSSSTSKPASKFTPSYYTGAPKTQIRLPKGKHPKINKLPVLVGTNPNLASPTTGPLFTHKPGYGATPVSIGPDLSKVSFLFFLFQFSLSFSSSPTTFRVSSECLSLIFTIGVMNFLFETHRTYQVVSHGDSLFFHSLPSISLIYIHSSIPFCKY